MTEYFQNLTGPSPSPRPHHSRPLSSLCARSRGQSRAPQAPRAAAPPPPRAPRSRPRPAATPRPELAFPARTARPRRLPAPPPAGWSFSLPQECLPSERAEPEVRAAPVDAPASAEVQTQPSPEDPSPAQQHTQMQFRPLELSQQWHFFFPETDKLNNVI
ncbi:uncharacterized protein LOC129081783 [Pteronotus mesoamericanus]|uniref:uncharacterized protein LOC129081783 n=1 Tax=Pteronotus mesoamericanus TaxID=1884717 RepID=UPI0023EA9F50|nr:uncharacterized protein LOC129081783 [Pteronotus parnellii mesoamericanus]